jgi:hypothetical protein
MGLYIKAKSYSINQLGQPVAYVVVKIHPFNMKLKASITLNNGTEYELINQWASEEEFDLEIEKFVRNKLYQ